MIDRKTLAYVFDLLLKKKVTLGVQSFNAVGFEKLTTAQAIDLIMRGHGEEIIFLKEESDWDEVLATALENILLCKNDQTRARETAKDILAKYIYYSSRLSLSN